jgi:hypothetical protein
MSDKPPWPATVARKVAEELVAELARRCERIQVAGAHRRTPFVSIRCLCDSDPIMIDERPIAGQT